MMGLLGKIFGTEAAIGKSIDLIASAGDALFYTDEEKANDKAKRAEQIDVLLIKWMETTTGQNLARRLLAVMISAVWLIQYIGSGLINLFGIWADDPDKWLKSAELIGGYADQMTGAMMLILGFYFAAPHMSAIVTTAMDRFGKSK